MKKLLLLVILVVMPLSISTAQGLYDDGDDYAYGCGYECEDDYRLIADIRTPDPIEEPEDYS